MEKRLTLTVIDGKFRLIDERGFFINGIQSISLFQDIPEAQAKIASVTVEIIVNIKEHEKNEDLPF